MKHTVKTLMLAGLAFAAFAPQAHAFGTPKPDEFVQKASVANMFEIETSKLALTRSTNADVKAFAQHMIDDHTAAGTNLKATADKAGYGANVASTLDEKHQKKLDKLTKEDAEDFDDEYVDAQESAHKKAVKLFKSYADDGDNADLKGFAAQTLPTLEAHKTEVQALEDKVDDAE